MKNTDLPGVIFTMRYPTDIGFVWKTIFSTRELVAKRLEGVARSFAAFPKILENSLYQSEILDFIEADFYDSTDQNKHHLSALLIDLNIKVIVFMSASPSSIDVSFFHKKNIATINTENDSFDQNEKQSYIRFIGKYLIRNVFRKNIHSLHVANSINQKKFLQNFGRFPEDRLEVVVNGIDIKKYIPGNREQACDSLGLNPDYFWVLAVSQSRPEKRVDRLIEIAADIYQQNINSRIRFIYIGDGIKHQEWVALASKYSLLDKFIFFGERKDVVSAYQAASVFIHAAAKESFGLVIAEAMACACPVIACAAPGPAEIISGSDGGVVVGLNDFSELKEKILLYESHEDIRKNHSINARIHVEKNFSIYRQADEFSALVRRFI